jgi:hypothetical protein
MTCNVANAAAENTGLPSLIPPCQPGQTFSITRPRTTRCARTGLHLVCDEQDPVTIRALPQTVPETGVGGNATTLAEHRFDEERRGVGHR